MDKLEQQRINTYIAKMFLESIGWKVQEDVTCFRVTTDTGETGELAWFELVRFAKEKGAVIQ